MDGIFWVSVITLFTLIILIFTLIHLVSYGIIKRRVLNVRRWGLNICCGKTDGGGVNADIVQHTELPNFVQVSNIHQLPFADGQFESVLCSHTLEHVDDPGRFFTELKRVGKEVTIVVPPLYDLGALLNFWEHKWIFLTWKKVHTDVLPRYVYLPFSRPWQRVLQQRIHA